jgi:hypothetical protein
MAVVRWTLAILLAAFVIAVPWVYFRWEYTHAKRLRIVAPGVLYRSGEMTADGFREAIELYHLRAIVNLQDEYPDPELYLRYFTTKRINESELCRQAGVRYIYIPPDLLPRKELAAHQPRAIAQFLDVMDDPANWPVLIHCRAGLHRTGIMTCVYRMEYEGWTPTRAIDELKANGFGEWPCTGANDYISQYILLYHPRNRTTSTIEGRTSNLDLRSSIDGRSPMPEGRSLKDEARRTDR